VDEGIRAEREGGVSVIRMFLGSVGFCPVDMDGVDMFAYLFFHIDVIRFLGLILALNSIVEVDVAGAVHIYSFGYFICSRGRFFWGMQ
jgi:hypothetical protein